MNISLLACGLLLAVGQISGLPCSVCDGNGGDDVCSCAQQVIRPPLVLPPLLRLPKKKPLEPKCSCQKESKELPPVYVPETACSCKKHKDVSPQNYGNYPQAYSGQRQKNYQPPNYGKFPQDYGQHEQHYEIQYPQQYEDNFPQQYRKLPEVYEEVQRKENPQHYVPEDEHYEEDTPSERYPYEDADEDADEDQHRVYKRSPGSHGAPAASYPAEVDGVSYYHAAGARKAVGVDAASRMLARQLEKQQGKSVKEDGLNFGPRTVPLDGEIKPTESSVDEGGLQQFDKEILELKTAATGFSEEEQDVGRVDDTKKLITYSQIGYRPSNSRGPEFLRRMPVQPKLPHLRRPVAQPPNYPKYHPERLTGTPDVNSYLDEVPHHHQHFQRVITRVQQALKNDKKPYFGAKKYY